MVEWKPISESYDQWLVDRLNSLGASEVPIVTFGSKFTSSLELFYQKIGAPKKSIENIRMYLGKETEDISANSLWQYYGGTEQSVVDNARKKTPVAKCEVLNASAFNSKYPHLSASPDRKILPFGKYEGKGFGSLEIKNTQSYVLKSYADELPPDNVLQLCTQLMVTEWSYGELFYFIDNMRCSLHEISRKSTKAMEELILTHTIPFWESVKICRPLYNQLYEAKNNYNMRLAAELEREIASYEPGPQNTAGYLNFLTDKYKERLSGAGLISGNDTQLVIAKKHAELGKKIDKIEVQKRQLEIELKNIIKENNVLDFGKNGSVSWFFNKNDKRIFLNKIK